MFRLAIISGVLASASLPGCEAPPDLVPLQDPCETAADCPETEPECVEVRIADVSRRICTTLCPMGDECYVSNATAAGRYDLCTSLASDGTIDFAPSAARRACIQSCDMYRLCAGDQTCAQTPLPDIGICLPE